MDEIKKKLEELLEAHTKKAVVSCDPNCMCWEIESLLCDLDMQAEKAAQPSVQADGAKAWRCKCGFKNNPNNQKCLSCGTPRRSTLSPSMSQA